TYLDDGQFFSRDGVESSVDGDWLDDGWLAPAVKAGETDLACVHAALAVLNGRSSERLSKLCRAAGHAYEGQLVEVVADELRHNGGLLADELAELSLAQL